MNSTQITCEQAKTMCDTVLPMLQYLGKLKDRINRGHFPFEDPLRRDVQRAFNAIRGLLMNLHYMSCAGASTERNKLDLEMVWRPHPTESMKKRMARSGGAGGEDVRGRAAVAGGVRWD